jgi:hypothetical protein
MFDDASRRRRSARLKTTTIICRECGREGRTLVGDVCDECLDERWPSELDVATVEAFDGFQHFDADFFPEDEEIFLEGGSLWDDK